MATTKVQNHDPTYQSHFQISSDSRIQIWLFEQKDLRIEGCIIGFDEYMNLVLEDAEEVNIKSIKALGRILLKGQLIFACSSCEARCIGISVTFLLASFYPRM